MLATLFTQFVRPRLASLFPRSSRPLCTFCVVQMCKKSRRIGCVIPPCNLQRGIAQPINRFFLTYLCVRAVSFHGRIRRGMMRMLTAAAAAAAMMFSESDYRIISGGGVGERGGPSRQIIADPSEHALALSVGRHGARLDSGYRAAGVGVWATAC